MANIFSFDGFIPVIHESAFIHPNASVIGDVVIGRDVYIGPGAVLRGDWGRIQIADGCNVQENCVVHMFPGLDVIFEPGAHVGHGAIIHGAFLGANCLVGMNAVVMDNVRVGSGAIVGALSFVPDGMVIPERKIAVGNPAKVVKDVTDEMLSWKSEGTRLYQALPAQLAATLREVPPLREEPAERPARAGSYRPWKTGGETAGKAAGMESAAWTSRGKRETSGDS